MVTREIALVLKTLDVVVVFSTFLEGAKMTKTDKKFILLDTKF